MRLWTVILLAIVLTLLLACAPLQTAQEPSGITVITAEATPTATQAQATAGYARLESTPVRPGQPTPSPAPETTHQVPILMYHHVRVNPDPADSIGARLSVDPEDFEAQMSFLARNGYRTISPRDLDTLRPGQNRRVIITFDDGYADAYEEAYPILRRNGFTATIYVITDLVDCHGHLTWEQIRELAADGMVIGSHTVGHPDLTAVSARELRKQLIDSRTRLELMLDKQVLDFAYPSGAFNSMVEAAVRHAGYKTAVTTRPGLCSPGQDRLALPRVRISGGMTMAEFRAAIGYKPNEVGQMQRTPTTGARTPIAGD